jgi:hypothetical protein
VLNRWLKRASSRSIWQSLRDNKGLDELSLSGSYHPLRWSSVASVRLFLAFGDCPDQAFALPCWRLMCFARRLLANTQLLALDRADLTLNVIILFAFLGRIITACARWCPRWRCRRSG